MNDDEYFQSVPDWRSFPEPPEQRGMLEWLPMFLQIPIFMILGIILLPFILLLYLLTMPVERLIFLCSGYSKRYPKYFWWITASTHYKLFKMLKKQAYAYEPDFYDHVLYVLEKDGVLHFVLCDAVMIYRWEEYNDWIYRGGHGTVGKFAVFASMWAYGQREYPDKEKQYYVCLTKHQIKRGMAGQDGRFISVKEVATRFCETPKV